MSARRFYTIECDGPSCRSAMRTDKPYVSQAREEATAERWHKVGESRQGALDFCSSACEHEYVEAQPPRKPRRAEHVWLVRP